MTSSEEESSVTPNMKEQDRKRTAEVTVDGGWGWAVVLGSTICHFFLLGINRSMGIVYLLLQERFNATAKETALAASIFVSVRAIGGPVGSKLSDRFGCRPVTMIGGVLLCFGIFISAFARNLATVYATFGIIAGCGGMLVFSPSYVAVSQWFDKKKGKAMAFSTLGTGLGSIVMAPVIMALVQNYGYFGTMIITGALLLHNSVGGALYRKPPNKRHAIEKVVGSLEVSKNIDTEENNTSKDGNDDIEINKSSDPGHSKTNDHLPNKSSDSCSEAQSETIGNANSNNQDANDVKTNKEDNSDGEVKHVEKKSVKHKNSVSDITVSESRGRKSGCIRSSLWTNGTFFIYCIMIMAVQGCIQSVLIFLPGSCRELGASVEQSSLILTVFGVADMIGRIVFGFVFDFKIFRQRRTHLYLAVTTMFATATILLKFMPSYVSLAAVVCVVAFFEGGSHSQRATNVTDLVEPSQMSIGVGLTICAQGFGNFYGPLVGGVLKDWTNSFASSFLFGGTTLFAACLLNTLNILYKHHTVKRTLLKSVKGPKDV